MRPWPILAGIVVLVVLAGFPLGWWTETQEHRQVRMATATAEADACRAAIGTVQKYRAPGQRTTVEEEATARVIAGTRPGRLGNWTATVGTANRCYIRMAAAVGNEAQTYSWTVDRTTGRVTADDDSTKRLSGW